MLIWFSVLGGIAIWVPLPLALKVFILAVVLLKSANTIVSRLFFFIFITFLTYVLCRADGRVL